MESDLLMKEDEFYRENEKLEKRTKELMRKVNDVMKIQDNLIKETLKTKTEMDHAKLNNYKIKTKSLESTGDCGGNEGDLGLPSSVEEMGRKGASHFYRAKIKCLQTENIKLQDDNKKKVEELKKLQKDNQKLLEEKEKWFTSYNAAKNTIGKLESQISSLNLKLQSRDSEMVSIKKELEQLKKELKSCNLNLNNSDVRLNRVYEENDKLKLSLKTVKDEEKELKESYRKQISDLTATVKHIEKHKIELIDGFKKQLQFIDILKKEKMYSEAHRIADMSEVEYLKILDWKME